MSRPMAAVAWVLVGLAAAIIPAGVVGVWTGHGFWAGVLWLYVAVLAALAVALAAVARTNPPTDPHREKR